MTYLVEFSVRAARDLEAIYCEKNAAESQAAKLWYNGLERAVLTLASHPSRCPTVPEGKKIKGAVWRQLLYGNKPHVYRIIYRIDDSQRKVFVAHIRHGARQNLKSADVAEF